MLTTKFENIPSSLRVRPQWVAWKAVPYTTKDGKNKINKIPVDAKTGLGAKTDDFTTWISFDQAVAHAQTNGLAGVGFVFCDMDSFTGFDFDNCIDEHGQVHPEVTAFLARLNSYTETSPSGNGIKVFVKAKFPLTAGNKIEKTGYGAECYNTRRYFTVTGHHLAAYPADVLECKEAQVVYTEIFGKPAVVAKPATANVGGTPTNLTEEAQRIREALEFIDPEDYESWLHMGFALKWWAGQGGGDQAKQIWDAWSSKSGKFQQGVNDYQWKQFDASGPLATDPDTGVQTSKAITLGTLYKRARDNGWSGTTLSNSNLPIVVLPPGGGTINEVGMKLGKLLAKSGTVFNRGGALVEQSADDTGEAILNPVTPARAPSLFEEVAALRKKDKEGEVSLAICPKQTAEMIMSSRRFLKTLPPIKVIAPCPVLVTHADGKLYEVCQYDLESGVMAGGEPTVSCTPEQAVALLDEVVADYDFVSPSDRARALASLITPALVLGGLLPGRAPIDTTEADVSQAGKGYRNRNTAAIYGLTLATVNKKSAGGVGSMEEAFDTHVIHGKPFISVDNVRGMLDSQKIESFCTEDSYLARALHVAATIDPRRTILMITSNKAEFQVDLVNRSSIVRIRKRAKEYKYRKYPEGDILAHIRANQPVYLGAVHTVIREWYAAGCPQSEVRQHDFAAWGGTLDWIVQNLLVAGPLLDDHAAIQQRVSNPHLNWLRDVTLAVYDAAQTDMPLKTIQLIDILERYKPEALADFLNPEDKLAKEDVQSRVLKGVGKRLGTFFNLDQCCVDVDVHTVCREEVMVERPSGGNARSTKQYTFRRTTTGGTTPDGNQQGKHPKGSGNGPADAKTPSNPNATPTERSKTPINPNHPEDLEILHKEELNNSSSSTNPASIGIIGNLRGFDGISQDTNGVAQGIPQKTPPPAGSLPAERRPTRPNRPAGGGLIDTPLLPNPRQLSPPP